MQRTQVNSRNTSVPQHVLELFWQLSSVDPTDRAAACAQLAHALAQEEKSGASDLPPVAMYCTKRLIRGFGSGRAAARQGYAAALAVCIRSLGLQRLPVHFLMRQLDEQLEPVTNSTKANDAREVYTGRVFGLAAIAHAVASITPSFSDDDVPAYELAQLVDRLLDDGSRRDFLLEPAVRAVLPLCRASAAVREAIISSSRNVRNLVVHASSPAEAETPEALTLALGLALLPEPTVHSKLIPSADASPPSWSVLLPAFDKTSRTYPRLHSAWHLTAAYLCRDGSPNIEGNIPDSANPSSMPSSRASSVWTALVEHGLLESSREHRGEALEVGRLFARKLEPGGAVALATPNHLSTIADHVSKGGRLRTLSERCLLAMLSNCNKVDGSLLTRLRRIVGEGKTEAMRRASNHKTRALIRSLENQESGVEDADGAGTSTLLSGIAKSMDTIDWLHDEENAKRLVEEAGRAWRESKLSLNERIRVARKLAEVGLFEGKAPETVRVPCANKLLTILGNPGAGVDRDIDASEDASKTNRMREVALRSEAVLEAVDAECRKREKNELPAKKVEMGSEGLARQRTARKALARMRKIRKRNDRNGSNGLNNRQNLRELERLAQMVSLLHLGWPTEYKTEIEAVPQILTTDASADGGGSIVSVILGLMGKGRWIARSAAERAFKVLAPGLGFEAISEMANALLAPVLEIFPENDAEEPHSEDLDDGEPGGDDEQEENDDGDDDDEDEEEEEHRPQNDSNKAFYNGEAAQPQPNGLVQPEEVSHESTGIHGSHAVEDGEEDEDEEPPNLGDEEMFKLDEALGQALREKKRSKSERERKAADFRFRVAGLFDAMMRDHPQSPLLPLLVPRLLQGVQKPLSADWPQSLRERLHVLLKKRVAKLPSIPNGYVPTNEVIDAAKVCFETAVRSPNELISASAQAAAHYMARVISSKRTSVQKDVVVDLYANTLDESCKNKKSRLQSSFFSSAAERLPFLGPRLVSIIADKAAEMQAMPVGRSRKDHVTVELAKLLPAMLRKPEEEASGHLDSACTRLASALPGLLRSTSHLKARKRAELCRALAEACELVQKWCGIDVLSQRVDTASVEDATSPLLEDGVPKKLSSPARRIRHATAVDATVAMQGSKKRNRSDTSNAFGGANEHQKAYKQARS